MRYFEPDWTLFDITERYPETKDVFVRHGFVQVNDEAKRTTFGKALQLDIALSMRQMDVEAFSGLLIQAIESAKESVQSGTNGVRPFKIKGLLPCPVRIPLQEQFDAFLQNLKSDGNEVMASLQSASMGLDWMKDEILEAQKVSQLDDLYISAGFDIFFEDEYFGRFVKQKQMGNPFRWKKINDSFDYPDLQLVDPDHQYGIIALVPAVFLVNTTILGERPIPKSWADLLHPMYERSVSLPVSDFDLFNAILLTLYRTYGPESVAALGRNMLLSMHPAQMVKSERQKENRPAITIMPNFFTKMVKEGSAMTAVWPEDGAIISPIFMIGKTDAHPLQEQIGRFLGSKAVAEILAHQGLFPTLHPEVDNHLPKGSRFMWLGWDFIKSHNLNQKFDECHKLFEQSIIS